MECGAGQVRGFSDEGKKCALAIHINTYICSPHALFLVSFLAISFLIPLEKMISIHADVNNVEACHGKRGWKKILNNSINSDILVFSILHSQSFSLRIHIMFNVECKE